MSPKFTAAHWGTYRVAGDGKSLHLAPLERDPHPAKIGEGWLDASQDKNVRIARPAVRKGWLEQRDRARSGDAAFVEVTWDEALDLVAEELKRTLKDYGNDHIFAGSYGWASAGRFHHAQSQMRRFLNTIGGFVSSRNTYSHAAAEVLWPYIVGESNKVFQDHMTSWPLVADHCELLVAFGGISKRPAQVTSSGTTMHETQDWVDRAAQNGCKIVSISPLRSDFASHIKADWIAPRPNTDCALILALSHEVIINGWADRDFLARCTHGADVFEAYVLGSDGVPKTADWASKICDVPTDTIRALAARMASNKTMINMSWSMQRADHGELTIWAGLALACLLGQVGQPGTGFAFGYGSTEPVGRPHRLIDWPSVPQGRNPVEDFIPVARISDMLENPGGSYTYDGQKRTYPDAKLIWWSGGNPFHHHQDLGRLDRLWQRPETVIVTDHSWTATARRADIVLPTTCALERDDFMINRRDTALVYMSAVLRPYSQARDDFDICAGLAARMGVHEAFTEGRKSQDWLHWLWADCDRVARAAGFTLPALDVFREQGVFDIPETPETRIQMAEFVADPDGHPRNTQSGKIELNSLAISQMALPDCPSHPEWRSPVEWLGEAAPGSLHLVSGQPNVRLHGQNDSSALSRSTKIRGREPCILHPKTAISHGLSAGDIVLIENTRGACLAGVTLSEDIRPDCIWLATGAWLDLREVDGRQICIHGNPNVLTYDKGSTGLSQGNIAHTTLVRIKKWGGDAPEIRVHRLPRFEERR